MYISGQNIGPRLAQILHGVPDYHCHFANQSSIAYIWCFRIGARNPRISELVEFSRESIIDVGAQIPNALSDGSIGLMTQI